MNITGNTHLIIAAIAVLGWVRAHAAPHIHGLFVWLWRGSQIDALREESWARMCVYACA